MRRYLWESNGIMCVLEWFLRGQHHTDATHTILFRWCYQCVCYLDLFPSLFHSAMIGQRSVSSQPPNQQWLHNLGIQSMCDYPKLVWSRLTSHTLCASRKPPVSRTGAIVPRSSVVVFIYVMWYLHSNDAKIKFRFCARIQSVSSRYQASIV